MPGYAEMAGIDEVLRQDEDTIQLELWCYDPVPVEQVSTRPNCVDPLSLYLSLRDTADERVQMALPELLDKFWNGFPAPPKINNLKFTMVEIFAGKRQKCSRPSKSSLENDKGDLNEPNENFSDSQVFNTSRCSSTATPCSEQ